MYGVSNQQLSIYTFPLAVLITGKRNNAVLVSEDDWRGIQETLHLMRVPGLAESIREGICTPIDQMDEDLDW